MTTPGSLKRYLNGAWQREGSFLLYVPTVSALPPSPDEDGIQAWAADTQKVYTSIGGTWVPQASGGGETGTEYTTTAATLTTGTGVNGTSSVARARKMGNWVQLYFQCVLSGNNGGTVNFVAGTLVPALRPSLALLLPGMSFPAYYPVRVNINAIGEISFVGNSVPATQTQYWLDCSYPLTS